VLDAVRNLKQHYPKLELIAGNVATAEGARALADAGADAVKVGVGPGSICTTRIIAGIGVPQLSAVLEAARGLAGTGVPLIADGGIKFSGRHREGLAAGAHYHDRLAAGRHRRSAGEVTLFEGRKFKATAAWAPWKPWKTAPRTATFRMPKTT
jgi:IMP dehydrogenase